MKNKNTSVKILFAIILAIYSHKMQSQALDSILKVCNVKVFTFDGQTKSRKNIKEIKELLIAKKYTIVFEATPSEFTFMRDYLKHNRTLASDYFYLKGQYAERYIDKTKFKTIKNLEKSIRKDSISIAYITKFSLHVENELTGIIYYLHSRKQVEDCSRAILDSIDNVSFGEATYDTLYLKQIINSIDSCKEKFYDFFGEDQQKVKTIVANIEGSLNNTLNTTIIDDFEKLKKSGQNLIVIRW